MRKPGFLASTRNTQKKKYVCVKGEWGNQKLTERSEAHSQLGGRCGKKQKIANRLNG